MSTSSVDLDMDDTDDAVALVREPPTRMSFPSYSGLLKPRITGRWQPKAACLWCSNDITSNPTPTCADGFAKLRTEFDLNKARIAIDESRIAINKVRIGFNKPSNASDETKRSFRKDDADVN
ncbi:hypothetical protein KI688_001960 [Linnemannia hyalina]|uniref:Uncharacterized protein n=1 Tax=Linnemannia hyalina TaxID=64524 RepID=A0A9P7XTY0_9FUNG|nr:hypothetical protein KI688_001960 [Linnemannia hyalina]